MVHYIIYHISYHIHCMIKADQISLVKTHIKRVAINTTKTEENAFL